MNRNIRIYDRFEWWSVMDCDCRWCVHYGGKDRPCSLEACCCADIREEAQRREQGSVNGSRARKGAAPCPE